MRVFGFSEYNIDLASNGIAVQVPSIATFMGSTATQCASKSIVLQLGYFIAMRKPHALQILSGQEFRVCEILPVVQG